MFKYLTHADWTELTSIIAFGLTFMVFAVMGLRAFVMRKNEVEHMASLPLDDEPQAK